MLIGSIYRSLDTRCFCQWHIRRWWWWWCSPSVLLCWSSDTNGGLRHSSSPVTAQAPAALLLSAENTRIEKNRLFPFFFLYRIDFGLPKLINIQLEKRRRRRRVFFERRRRLMSSRTARNGTTRRGVWKRKDSPILRITLSSSFYSEMLINRRSRRSFSFPFVWSLDLLLLEPQTNLFCCSRQSYKSK